MSPYHTALRCLFVIALHHGITLRPEELAAVTEQNLFGSALRVMRRAHVKTNVLKHRTWRDLSSLGRAYPALAVRNDGTWVVVVDVITLGDGTKAAAVLDPVNEAAGVTAVMEADFCATWDGTIILAKRIYDLSDENQPFGLRWFMPEIIKHASSFRGIAIAAVLSNLIGYTTPLLFQTIIDKVVPHHSYQTLLFVILVFVTLILFDALFNYVRQNLMLVATNKIDARLASKIFEHLLGLPLDFFERTPAGVLNQHMMQTQKLRNFLTGRIFQVMLDAAVLPVLVVLLCIYSFKLTVVVAAFSILIALVIAAMVPTFRYQLDRLYSAEGGKQAHVVETLHSMRAVKSLVLEAERQKSWDQKISLAVRRLTIVGRVSALGGAITQSLDKLMSLSVLAIGALAVFDGSLTVGALVAFNMLSGRMTGPFIQMVGLINDYQEAMLSVKMLGSVMNHPLERNSGQRHATPTITGNIEFANVQFTYPGGTSPALRNVTFDVKEGQMIGVVGRSGSGKTTITRLVQAIQTPQEGLIRLNGVDIRQIDLNHLRRSIGVVLQENLLFRGTIKENIAAARPDATMEEVVEAARLAGADEFIDRLPMSYDTFIEEGATNFSGGQRQRMAIARALLTRPKLLIFDEATSALDPDSEAIVQSNLTKIAEGRTMLIVSHRLSSLVDADATMVLEKGELVDFAPHEVLLQRCDVYRHLWQTQTRHLQ